MVSVLAGWGQCMGQHPDRLPGGSRSLELLYQPSGEAHSLELWYQQPAQKWTEALPIGNGRLGAMIFGGVGEDHLQFNESTLWSGGPRDYQREGAYQYLATIRQLLSESRQPEAEDLAEKHFMGRKDKDDTLYLLQRTAWLKKVRRDTTAAGPGYDDRDWHPMSLPTPDGWETAGLEGVDGAVWFRTSFELPQAWAGKDLVLDLGRIRDEDFTYINGSLVGSSEGISTKRHYTIPAALLRPGRNVIAVQVINFDDKGGFTGVKGDRPALVVYPAGGNPQQGLSLSPVWKYHIQNEEPPMLPKYEADYQPFGDLYLQFPGQDSSTNYRRGLDLRNAISNLSYDCNGVHYTREYFASVPQRSIVIHIGADHTGSVSLQTLLRSPHRHFTTRRIDDSTLALFVQVRNGVLKGVASLHVQALHGRVRVSDDRISVSGADAATLYLTAATSFINCKNVSGDPAAKCRQVLRAIGGRKYQDVRAAHIKEYRSYFAAYSIDLGHGPDESLPTDQRIVQYDPGKDPSLIALYQQYGRYLLISSSRPGSPEPANLQGLWNDLLTPPWGSKYTTNINLEMNYWPSETLNLSSCSAPLFRMMKELSVAGALTARAHYGAPGWVLHHNTDLWRGTAPINASNHGIWVTGGAWLCHQLWEHYLFTRDRDFLREYYPVMKAAAEFFVHFLVKDPRTGWLISTPSNSPEHGGLVAGPSMDHQIIRDLFSNCIAAAGILHTDSAFRRLLHEKYRQIAPSQIGRYGQLQEWMEDKDDTADHHRHVSHLWAVYPGTDITADSPALMQAARQSLRYRGDDGTGWSLAWKVNLWARFREGDHALSLIDKLLSSAAGTQGGEKGGVYPNMFDAHPPFQIDGNFGGAAGIAELLIQSQGAAIDLLPALPAALPEGEVRGICARGGYELKIRWSAGKLVEGTLISRTGGDCTLRYGERLLHLSTQKGRSYTFTGELKLIK